MIEKYLKNIDTVNHTYSGKLIQPGEYYLIPEDDLPKFRNDSQLLSDITNGLMQIAKSNDGNFDIVDVATQINFLLGLQAEITNKPIVQTDKPAGYSKTYVTHNFCDSASWADPNDSTWELDPPTGQKYSIIRAEVQFTKDIQLSSAVPAGEFYYDFWAGGAKVADESHTIKNMGDLLALGNKTYSIPYTVDGWPEMTTIIFDYADSIVLTNSELEKIVLSTKDHVEIGGTYCSISFVVRPEAE